MSRQSDQPRAQRTPSDRKLFISHLSSHLIEDDIRKEFAYFGRILAINMRRNSTGVTFAFIQFAEPEDAAAAMKEYYGKHLFGRPIRLEYALGPRNSNRNGSNTQGCRLCRRIGHFARECPDAYMYDRYRTRYSRERNNRSRSRSRERGRRRWRQQNMYEYEREVGPRSRSRRKERIRQRSRSSSRSHDRYYYKRRASRQRH